jgi:hypothetical protein
MPSLEKTLLEVKPIRCMPPNRRFQRHNGSQLFIRAHNETLSVAFTNVLNFSGFFMLDRSLALRFKPTVGYLG